MYLNSFNKHYLVFADSDYKQLHYLSLIYSMMQNAETNERGFDLDALTLDMIQRMIKKHALNRPHLHCSVQNALDHITHCLNYIYNTTFTSLLILVPDKTFV